MTFPTLPGRWHALAAAVALAMTGAAAHAGEPDVEHIVQMALADSGAMDMDLDFDDASFDFAFDEMGGERLVKGAPYCADAVHETVQTLTDGNRIVRKQQTRLCRDGEGRTRQEVDRNGRKIVWLRDPVARQGWVLDPQRKTARRLGHFGHAMWFNDSAMGPMQAEEWREFAEKVREQARAGSHLHDATVKVLVGVVQPAVIDGRRASHAVEIRVDGAKLLDEDLSPRGWQ